jgi:hypothetical protein
LTSSSSLQPVATDDFRDELPFGHRRIVECDVGGNVLDGDFRARQCCASSMCAQMFARAPLGERQRQKIVEVPPAHAAPAQMFRDERRLDARDEPRELVEVRADKGSVEPSDSPTPCNDSG